MEKRKRSVKWSRRNMFGGVFILILEFFLSWKHKKRWFELGLGDYSSLGDKKDFQSEAIYRMEYYFRKSNYIYAPFIFFLSISLFITLVNYYIYCFTFLVVISIKCIGCWCGCKRVWLIGEFNILSLSIVIPFGGTTGTYLSSY